MGQVFWTVKDLGKVWDEEEWERGVGLGWNREGWERGRMKQENCPYFECCKIYISFH